jgi:class 3 adenylate cyclase/predicted ATPase
MNVTSWLDGLGLTRYAEVFAQNDIDAEVLPALTEADLTSLGVSLGHRKKLLAAIVALGDTKGASAPPAPAPPSEAERRQITVMFCDLVGSTALSEQLDPEDLRDLMAAYQHACGAVINGYDGHVAQYLGDGLMTYFGWPRAHEDDAERAVRAALDIVQAVKQVSAPSPLEVRVGIATGPVVVGETGGGDASIPKLAVGETPNIAARIQGLAGADEIVMAPTTRRLLGAIFDIEERGEHTLKGIVEPLDIARVIGIGTAEGRFDAAHGGRIGALVGRDAEMAMLADRWSRALDGEGQVVTLCGEPGIGKSRLVRAIRDLAAADDHHVLAFQCSPYHANTAFYPITQQFARAAGLQPGDAPSERLDKLEHHVGAIGMSLEEAMPLFAATLSIPTGDRYPPLDMAPEAQKRATVESLGERAVALSRDKPLLFLFEDTHWIDPTSLEALGVVVQQAAEARILAVITHRPEFEAPWRHLGHFTDLTLARLSKRRGSELLGNVTGGKALPDEVVAEIMQRTDGVPLFVEELTKAVIESGLVAERDGTYQLVGALTSMKIPLTLQDSLMARLDRLAPIKDVAQTAACIGREFSHRLIAAVSPLDGAALSDALRQLAESELIFAVGSPPDTDYAFKHALVQHTAYESLLRSRRAQIHAAIAEAIERTEPDTVANDPGLLAHHLGEAGQMMRALEYWRRAGQHAAERSANQEAVAHFTTAIDLLSSAPEGPERDKQELTLRIELGPQLIANKGQAAEETEDNYRAASSLAERVGSSGQRFTVNFGLWLIHQQRGEFQGARAILSQVRDAAEAENDDALKLQAHHAGWTTLFFVGDLGDCQSHVDAGAALYSREDHADHAFRYGGHDPGICCHATAGAALWHLGFPDQAIVRSDMSVALADDFDHSGSAVVAYFYELMQLQYRKDIARLNARAEAFIDYCESRDLTHYLGSGGIAHGWGLAASGDIDRGMALIDQGLAAQKERGVQMRRTYYLTVRAEVLVMAGRTAEARDTLDEATEIVEKTGEIRSHPEILRLQGVAAAPDRAEEFFQESLNLARSQGARSLELRTAFSRATAYHDQGRGAEALETLSPILDWFTEGFATGDLVAANDLRARLA